MHRSPINPRIMKPVRFGAERIYLDIYITSLKIKAKVLTISNYLQTELAAPRIQAFISCHYKQKS